MSSEELKDYVLNPFSGRLIKKNSKTHKRLVSAKLLDQPYEPSPVNTIMETESTSEAKQMQAKINKKAIGQNKVVTRRNNKVLTATRRPKRQEVIDRVTDLTMESVLEQKDHILNQEMTDAELDNYIKQIIQSKLVGNKTPAKKADKIITTRRQSKYVVKDPQEQDPFSSEEEEELIDPAF